MSRQKIQKPNPKIEKMILTLLTLEKRIILILNLEKAIKIKKNLRIKKERKVHPLMIVIKMRR